MRVSRTELAVPGSNPEMAKKAASSAADEVFLDLEDSVAPKEKEPSRKRIVQSFQQIDFGKRTRVVRVNDMTTRWAYGDIVEVVEGAGDMIDCIMIPKVRGPEDVRFVDMLLSQIEMHKGLKRRIGIEAQIENASGFANVEAIAKASHRLETLIFGPGDYAASTGIPMLSIGAHDFQYPGHIWHAVLVRIVAAANAAGLQAIDGPYGAYKDMEHFKQSANMARMLGFDGKWAVHPTQIDVLNQVFSPTEDDVARAKRIAERYKVATEQEGLGAVAFEGEMIDAASLRLAERVLARARLCGMA